MKNEKWIDLRGLKMENKIIEAYPEATQTQIEFMTWFFDQTDLTPGDITMEQWQEYDNMIGEINPDKVGTYIEHIEPIVRVAYAMGIKQQQQKISELEKRVDALEIGQGELFNWAQDEI